MDVNQSTWDSLRSKGYTIDNFYVQTGVGPLGARMLVVINGVAMSFHEARELDARRMNFGEIARQH
jgi:hypothetical protein